MARFKTPREFEKVATKEDFEALKSAYTSTRSDEWNKHADTYGFSRSSALRVLRDANMIDNKRKHKTAEPEAAQGLKFRDIKLKTAQRTFYIADDTWERLHQLYDAYPSRNNTYIKSWHTAEINVYTKYRLEQKCIRFRFSKRLVRG